jgi:hypothetical protein
VCQYEHTLSLYLVLRSSNYHHIIHILPRKYMTSDHDKSIIRSIYYPYPFFRLLMCHPMSCPFNHRSGLLCRRRRTFFFRHHIYCYCAPTSKFMLCVSAVFSISYYKQVVACFSKHCFLCLERFHPVVFHCLLLQQEQSTFHFSNKTSFSEQGREAAALHCSPRKPKRQEQSTNRYVYNIVIVL